METIIAILVYFGLMSFGESNLTPPVYQFQIQSNQQLIHYYQTEMDELRAIRAQIDRLED